MSQPYDVPLFGGPDPAKVQRVQSHKDRDEAANKVTWRRTAGQMTACRDCLTGTRATGGPTRTASFIRTEAGAELPLCYQHKALRDEADAIGKPRG